MAEQSGSMHTDEGGIVGTLLFMQVKQIAYMQTAQSGEQSETDIHILEFGTGINSPLQAEHIDLVP